MFQSPCAKGAGALEFLTLLFGKVFFRIHFALGLEGLPVPIERKSGLDPCLVGPPYGLELPLAPLQHRDVLLAGWIGYTDVDSSGRGAGDGRAVYAFLREGRGRDCLGTAPVNSVYVFDDRVVLNINFTDDAKTVTREEVFGSSAVDNVPTCWDRTH